MDMKSQWRRDMNNSIGRRRSLCLLLLGVVCLLAANTALSAVTDNLHINEILFNPATGGYQWVELKIPEPRRLI
jgi:hypothetical protein